MGVMNAAAECQWLWAKRVLVVLAGGVMSLIATWVVAFGWYGVPSTTSGVNEVVAGVWPIAGGFGCLIAAVLRYRAERRRRAK